jgi:hypothetical protein
MAQPDHKRSLVEPSLFWLSITEDYSSNREYSDQQSWHGIAKGTGTIPLSLFLCEKIFYLRKRNFATGWINDKSGN